MGDNGTAIFLFDLACQTLCKSSGPLMELNATDDDIVLNPMLFDKEAGNSLLEESLKKYLKYLYIEYPKNVKISINGKEIDLINPYSIIKNNHNNAFYG